MHQRKNADILPDQEKGERIYFGAYVLSFVTHYLPIFYRFPQCSSRLHILCGLNQSVRVQEWKFAESFLITSYFLPHNHLLKYHMLNTKNLISNTNYRIPPHRSRIRGGQDRSVIKRLCATPRCASTLVRPYVLMNTLQSIILVPDPHFFEVYCIYMYPIFRHTDILDFSLNKIVATTCTSYNTEIFCLQSLSSSHSLTSIIFAMDWSLQLCSNTGRIFTWSISKIGNISD